MSGMSYVQRLKHLNTIKHNIRKKRIVFDEGIDKFGMDEMSQLVKVRNTSQVKGYPFVAWKKSDEFKYGLKIVPVETKYEKENHPANLEYIVLRELTENVVNAGVCPHIVHYLGHQKVSNKNRALKFLNLKRLEVEGGIRTHSLMLVSEYITGGSLDNWIFNLYENDESISDTQWRAIVFQLVYCIAILQSKYKMMHNDFHYGNILIDTSVMPGGYFVYKMGGKDFYIPNTGVIPKLWDFEFSMVYSNYVPDAYPNKFIIGSFEYDEKVHKTKVEDEVPHNVPYNYNETYDLHYFLTSLLDLYISQELFDWILTLYPAELIPDDDNDSSSQSSSPSTRTTANTHTQSTVTTQTPTTRTAKTVATVSTDSLDQGRQKTQYLDDGRLINGADEVFDLPTPTNLLTNPFFSAFMEKPDDFDPETAVYFDGRVVKTR